MNKTQFRGFSIGIVPRNHLWKANQSYLSDIAAPGRHSVRRFTLAAKRIAEAMRHFAVSGRKGGMGVAPL